MIPMTNAQEHRIHAYHFGIKFINIICAIVDQIRNALEDRIHVQVGFAGVARLMNAQKEKHVGWGNAKVCD